MITLATNGTSNYSVMIDLTVASPSEKHAVSELAAFVLRVTRAVLPIRQCGKAQGNNRRLNYSHIIAVGRSGITAEWGLDQEIDSVGDEGFIIRTVGENVVIAGGRQRGTLYGVYEFLEAYLGCRWYTPDVSNIPTRNTVKLPEIDIRKTPAFSIREAFDITNFNGDWSARNKVNGSNHWLMEHHGGSVRCTGVHSFNRLVPPEVYFNEHPEYFSEVNGVRIKEGDVPWVGTQLCLTNPDVLRIAIESMKRIIKEYPECSIFSVSQNDWGNWCTCENCRKVDEEEESQMGTVLRFANAVHDAIKRDYPHVSIDTLAYTYTRKPPKITKPRPGLLIRLCSIECCFGHPMAECSIDRGNMPSNFTQDIRAWSEVSRDIYLWEYTTDFPNYLMPFPNLNVLKPNLLFFKEHGVMGLFEEGAPNSPLSYAGDLRQYMLAKLMYDLSLDDKLLMDEFCAGVYGPAAPYVKAYYEFWQQKSIESGEHLFNDPPVTYIYFTRENLDFARSLLVKAAIMAADDATRLRIEKIMLSCDFMDMVQMEKGEAKSATIDALFAKCKEMGMYRVTEWHTFEESAKAFKEMDAQLPKPRTY